jgi:hypothetical protein
MKSNDLLEQVIAAHGGRARWQAVERIEFSLSSGGLAFSLHLQPWALHNLEISLQPHARRVVLRNFCHKGWSGVWTANYLQIQDGDGILVAERHDPRKSFSRLDKQVRWDKLDILYFAGYALWNYLGFPFILESPGVSLDESLEPNSRRLLARFDPTVPTHSEHQAFHIDASGLLTRHDYTADVIGSWANAANLCLASEMVDGLRFYTRRRVFPRFGTQTVLPFPTLVWIDIDAIRLVPFPHSTSA